MVLCQSKSLSAKLAPYPTHDPNPNSDYKRLSQAERKSHSSSCPGCGKTGHGLKHCPNLKAIAEWMALFSKKADLLSAPGQHCDPQASPPSRKTCPASRSSRS
eukprot:1898009-Rhodomonas_salina.2